jgi:succinyl-diaminopimelate desuccinylase
MSTELIDLLTRLIAFPSVTPDDAGCQDFIGDYLENLGFTVHHLPVNRVRNCWATIGSDNPEFVFAGHTDVVPVGRLEEWHSAPFVAEIRDGRLFGRGTADMKSGVAAIILAAKNCLKQNPNLKFGILLTSAEEGDDYLDGTPKIMEYLEKKGIKPKYCIVGEPSSHTHTGDCMRIGRRGSLNANLTVFGKQGHVAYTELADNPIHRALPALAELVAEVWDQGNDYFPATQCQISNLNSGTGASNVIPGILESRFNFRYSPELSQKQIQDRVESLLNKHGLRYQLDWRLSGEPFLTRPDAFVDTLQSINTKIRGAPAELSTGGGTSDARFIAPYGIDVVELGVSNATIHQVNEFVSLQDLTDCYEIYLSALMSCGGSQ